MKIERHEPEFRPITISIESKLELRVIQRCLAGNAGVELYSDLKKQGTECSLTEVENIIYRLNDLMKI